MKAVLKRKLLGSVDALTSRHTTLLPLDARDERSIFTLNAPYRVAGSRLTITLQERVTGQLTVTLVTYDGHFPTKELWTSAPLAYEGPTTFEFDLDAGSVRLGAHDCGCAPIPSTRRFCWRFVLTTPAGVIQRMTGHYRADAGRTIGAEYYFGDDYVDYDAQSAGEHVTVVGLLSSHKTPGPILEFGCATGRTLDAMCKAGFDAIGVDISAWAIEQAARLVGPDRAFQCEAGSEVLPAPVLARAPFGAVLMWAVLEHFERPFEMIRQLRDVTRPGSLLFINTTNADSLSHHILGEKWEGYYDWSHYGVDQVSVRSMRSELDRLGWKILQLTTDTLWASDADPFAATLRDWFSADARFRRLLSDRELGDFITCVAVRR